MRKENLNKKLKKKDPKLEDNFCRLRIDKRTVIYCRTEESYNQWMRKYPDATKVDVVLTDAEA
jgi:hypothetical protein